MNIPLDQTQSFQKVVAAQTAVFLTLFHRDRGRSSPVASGHSAQNLDPTLFDPFAYGETYGYKTNARGIESGAVYVTDDRGFRMNPTSKPGDAQRKILVLGDSVSVGIGVAADESYPNVLQQRWPAQRVLNASVTGYGITDYGKVLDKVARRENLTRSCWNVSQRSGRDEPGHYRGDDPKENGVLTAGAARPDALSTCHGRMAPLRQRPLLVVR